MTKVTSKVTSHKKKTGYRALPFIICGLASFFYVYEFFLRVTPGVISQELMQQFNMDAAAFGVMSAFFYYGYTPMQVPAGILIDRFGARALMSFAMLLCAFGAILFGVTHNAALLSVSRAMMGFASSFAFVGALVLVARWFPPKYFALITGLIQLMGCLGAIGGQTPVAMLTGTIGWRATMISAGGIGILFGVLFWLIIRDGPKKIDTHAHLNYKEHPTNLLDSLKNELGRLIYVCKNPQTWAAAICGFSCWAPIVTFAALWGVPFLMVDYGINSTDASIGNIAIWLGIAIASPLVGWWSNAVNSRRLPLIVCYVAAILSSLGVIYIPHPPMMLMYALLFVFGAAAASQAVTFGVVQDNNPISVEGTAMGFNNMAVIFGGVVIQPISGLILNYCWTGRVVNNVPMYSYACYEKALFLIPVCGVIGLLTSLFFLKETHCRPQFESELPKQVEPTES